MEWYVYRHDTNKGVIYKYNVLQPWIIKEIKERMERTTTLSDFKEILERVLRYHYWSKCEHEIIIKEWTGKPSEIKIDVFDQLLLNWEVFCRYVWNSFIDEGIEEKEVPGYWIYDESGGIVCSKCKNYPLESSGKAYLSDFCPFGGHRMENCSCGLLLE